MIIEEVLKVTNGELLCGNKEDSIENFIKIVENRMQIQHSLPLLVKTLMVMILLKWLFKMELKIVLLVEK